jgi:hypothetical protein
MNFCGMCGEKVMEACPECGKLEPIGRRQCETVLGVERKELAAAKEKKIKLHKKRPQRNSPSGGHQTASNRRHSVSISICALATNQKLVCFISCDYMVVSSSGVNCFLVNQTASYYTQEKRNGVQKKVPPRSGDYPPGGKTGKIRSGKMIGFIKCKILCNCKEFYI